jgi:hypothetical protein
MKNLDNFGESIDRLLNVDVVGRGIIHNLYNRARQIENAPLALHAATALFNTVKSGDNVILTTGFPIPPTMVPETDGPLGAVVLARAFHTVLGANSIVVAEEDALDVTAALAKAIEIPASKPEQHDDVMVFRGFPLAEKIATDYSTSLLNEFQPSALVAIEKVGRNRRGIYHKMNGNDISNYAIKVDPLFVEAETKGILTIGIGDGGNEIGMGQILDAVRQYVPNGAMCKCPCRGGIACETTTRHLVTATVSNWGAYGIAACLSALNGTVEALHSGDKERILLMEASRKGAVDGVTGESTPSCDGLSEETHVHFVELLRELTAHSI